MGLNGYWVSFEFNNGMIATWSDYASSPDEFIDDLLKKEKGKHIKKFVELICDDTLSKPIHPGIKISVAKYNAQLRAQHRVYPDAGRTQSQRGEGQDAPRR